MATQHPTSASRSHQENLLHFQQLEDYAWDRDSEFQRGLQAILGPNPSAEQAEHLTLRARCFYFARKNNTSIDFNVYQSWRSQKSSSNANGISVITSTSDPSSTINDPPRIFSASHSGIDTNLEDIEATAPYPISFSQIVELITSGGPIPGVKEVPDTVLKGQASLTTTIKRKKPWEKDDAGAGEEFIETDTSVVNNA